jgi:hypothetical protein
MFIHIPSTIKHVVSVTIFAMIALGQQTGSVVSSGSDRALSGSVTGQQAKGPVSATIATLTPQQAAVRQNAMTHVNLPVPVASGSSLAVRPPSDSPTAP